jgi:hypothetical protein
MALRLNEWSGIDLGQHRGYFDLSGRWEGLKLVMDDHGEYSTTLRSALRAEHASVAFESGSFSEFKPRVRRHVSRRDSSAGRQLP